MKILYLYKDYFPVLGGIENHCRQLAEEMQRRGHSVEVLVTNTARSTRHEELSGVKIFKAGRWINISSAPLSPRLGVEVVRRYLSRTGPDIVHLHAPYPPGEAAWLLASFMPRFTKKRPHTIMTYHSDIVRQKRLLKGYAPVLRQVLRRVDWILPTSPNYIQSSPFLRVISSKCRSVSLGVDFDRFATATPPPEDPSNLKLLFTGRLRYYKGLQYLIEAMPAVLPTAHLTIVGSGPMEAELKAQVDRLTLNRRVTFAGEVSEAELPGYYAACDLFVLPSCERSEAYGLVQLEAMAAGKPVVSTSLGTGTDYLNLTGQTGLVVPSADPGALAVAINELLANKNRRHEMGRRAAERVRTEFSLQTMFDRIEQIYIEVSSGE